VNSDARPTYSETNPPLDLLEAVQARLERVCTDWPRELFDEMTRRAAWIEYKYDQRDMTRTLRRRMDGQEWDD
jgi:hypothetical protein